MNSSPQVSGIMLTSVPSLLLFATWSATCGAKASSISPLQAMEYNLKNANTEEIMEYINTVIVTVPAPTCLESTIESTAQASSSPASAPAPPSTTQEISTVVSVVISAPDSMDIESHSATVTQLLTAASTVIQPTAEAPNLEKTTALRKQDVACRSESCATTAVTFATESPAFTGPVCGSSSLNGTQSDSACVTTVTTFVTLPFSFTEPIGSFSTLSGAATDNPCTTTITTLVTLSPNFTGPIGGYSTLFNTEDTSSSTLPNLRARNVGIVPIPTRLHQLPAVFDTRRFTSKPYRERPIRSVAPTNCNATPPFHKSLGQRGSTAETLPVRQVGTTPPAHNALPNYIIVLIGLACVSICFGFCAFLACGT